MADVWVGRFNRYVEKLFNIKGGPALVDLDGSIQPMLPLFVGAEDRYLQSWNLFGMAATQAGVAGNKSAFNLRNPANSGIIAVIEKISWTVAAGQVNVGVAGAPFSADLATTATGIARADARQNGRSVCITSTDAPASDPGTNFLNIWAGTGPATAYDLIQPATEVVVSPGISFRIIAQTLNQVATFSIWWRERPLEPSEST